MFERVEHKYRNTFTHLNPTFQSRNFIKFLRVSRRFYTYIPGPIFSANNLEFEFMFKYLVHITQIKKVIAFESLVKNTPNLEFDDSKIELKVFFSQSANIS